MSIAAPAFDLYSIDPKHVWTRELPNSRCPGQHCHFHGVVKERDKRATAVSAVHYYFISVFPSTLGHFDVLPTTWREHRSFNIKIVIALFTLLMNMFRLWF